MLHQSVPSFGQNTQERQTMRPLSTSNRFSKIKPHPAPPPNTGKMLHPGPQGSGANVPSLLIPPQGSTSCTPQAQPQMNRPNIVCAVQSATLEELMQNDIVKTMYDQLGAIQEIAGGATWSRTLGSQQPSLDLTVEDHGSPNNSRGTSLAPSDSDSQDEDCSSEDETIPPVLISQPVTRPAQYPLEVLWSLGDYVSELDCRTTEDESKPLIQRAIRHTDGRMISDMMWASIKISARIIKWNLLNLPDSQDPKAKGQKKTKIFFQQYYNAQWWSAIARLEDDQPLLTLCAEHWKAEHVLGCILANSARKEAAKNDEGEQSVNTKGGRGAKRREPSSTSVEQANPKRQRHVERDQRIGNDVLGNESEGLDRRSVLGDPQLREELVVTSTPSSSICESAPTVPPNPPPPGCQGITTSNTTPAPALTKPNASTTSTEDLSPTAAVDTPPTQPTKAPPIINATNYDLRIPSPAFLAEGPAVDAQACDERYLIVSLAP